MIVIDAYSDCFIIDSEEVAKLPERAKELLEKASRHTRNVIRTKKGSWAIKTSGEGEKVATELFEILDEEDIDIMGWDSDIWWNDNVYNNY